MKVSKHFFYSYNIQMTQAELDHMNTFYDELGTENGIESPQALATFEEFMDLLNSPQTRG